MGTFEETLILIIIVLEQNNTYKCGKPILIKMDEKGVIFGAGFLGKKVSEEFGYPTCSLDVLNLPSLSAYLDQEKPGIIINAVGKTGRPNIDWCEEHKGETIMSNFVGAVNLCVEAAKRGIYFVHLGSGCVYDGDNNGKGYTEEDEPNFYGPQFYAKTKILAEKALKEFPCLQIRLRMPVDDMPHDRNFIDKVKKYSKVIDIQNSMTTVPHMLKALKVLIEKRKTGIYNFVNPGTISAKEIMQMYKEIIKPEHEFEVFSLEELDSITKGKRSNCYLNTDKLKGEGIELPEIHEAIRECLMRYKENEQNTG